MFIISVHVRSESCCKKPACPGKLGRFFALPGTYYAGFMSLFVAFELIIVIYYSLDQSISLEQ